MAKSNLTSIPKPSLTVLFGKHIQVQRCQSVQPRSQQGRLQAQVSVLTQTLRSLNKPFKQRLWMQNQAGCNWLKVCFKACTHKCNLVMSCLTPLDLQPWVHLVAGSQAGMNGFAIASQDLHSLGSRPGLHHCRQLLPLKSRGKPSVFKII